MERNLRERANSRNAITTFTELSHPPLFGSPWSMLGNMAKMEKGRAKAKAKPNIPNAGPRYCPIEAACTRSVPMMGPVHENETSTNVNAMKKRLTKPVVESLLLSILLVHLEGRTNSNAPKKDTAKSTNRAKKIRLKTALVASSFSLLPP